MFRGQGHLIAYVGRGRFRVRVRAHAHAIRHPFLTARAHGLIRLDDTSCTMKKKLRATMAFVLALVAIGARADWKAPDSVMIEGGVTAHNGRNVTAGITWPSGWHHTSHTGEWTASTELFVSEWSTKFIDHRRSLTQLGIVPVVRYRFNHGGSDWFAEGGIGLTYFDGLYQRGDRRFSTRLNFQDTLGVGRSFGARREHEASLRISHVSNAGLREPNPGENFVQLRYAHRF